MLDAEKELRTFKMVEWECRQPQHQKPELQEHELLMPSPNFRGFAGYQRDLESFVCFPDNWWNWTIELRILEIASIPVFVRPVALSPLPLLMRLTSYR